MRGLGAIAAMVGANGGGKTLAGVELAVIPAVDEGRVIVANFALEVPDAFLLSSWAEIPRLGVHVCRKKGCRCGLPYRMGPRGNPIHHADRRYHDGLPIFSLTRNRPVLLFLDEITACLPSRNSMSMPAQLQRLLNQLRKHDVQLVWTAPNFARCDKIVREVTQTVTVCHGHLPDRWVREPVRRVLPKPLLVDGAKVPNVGAWRPRRLFRYSTYDAIDFEEFTLNDQLKIRPLWKSWYWRPVHTAQFLYDTLDAVELLDHLDDHGSCIRCNGKRSPKPCRCIFEDEDESYLHTDDEEAERPKAAGRGAGRPHPTPSFGGTR